MKAKNATLLTLMLLSLVIPFTSETQGEEKAVRPTKELRASPKGAERPKILDQDDSQPDREFRELLSKVENRLMAGEDPDTPMDLLVHWEEYEPDFPEWVDVQETFTLIPVIHVECALEDVESLSELPYVSKVVENRKGTIAKPTSFTYGNDPYVGDYPLYLNETYPLVDASTPDATAGAGTLIAVLSTGINDSHPMLNDFDDDNNTDDPKIIDWYNAYTPNTDNRDDLTGWGTALASIVAGTGAAGGQLIYNKSLDYFHRLLSGTTDYDTQEVNKSITMGSQMGLAPGAALLDINIYDTTTGTTTNDDRVIRGMEWAVAHGADIILLHAERRGSTVVDAIEALTNCGVLVIVQAGDWDASTDASGYLDGDVAPYYSIESPASAPSALTVGATTETDALWLRSNRGPVSGTETSKPDVVAPGVGILAANYNWSEHEEGDDWNGNSGDDDSLYFQLYDSTACAAAVAAGVSAQLIANFPGASPTAIKIALRQSALDLGFNEMAQGKGKIQLGAANDTLTAASKLANYTVGHYQERNFSLTLPTYDDFENYRVLVDGSFSTSFAGGLPDPYDWSEMPNGNLTRDTPHPYVDNAAGFTWHNFSFPGANFTDFDITGASVGSGDNITLWADDNPAGTNIGTATVLWDDTVGAATPSSSSGEVYVFIRYYSDGNGDATTSDGINGTLDLQYMARTASPDTGDDEFETGLVDWLTSMGATVHYWHAAGANGPPTATILEYYDAYFLPQPLAGNNYAAMSMPNETAYYQYLAGNLSTYLAAGGNVLFLGDNEHPYYNYATSSPFNTTWHEGGAGGPTTQIASHNITTTPYTIEKLLITAPLTYLGAGNGTTIIVNDTNVPSIVSYEDAGGGKAVFIADEDMFNDPRWTDPPTEDPEHDNSLLAANIFYWFFNATKDSGSTPSLIELGVPYYKAPKVMANGSQWTVEAEIQNIGNVTAGALVTFGMGWSSTWTGALGGTLSTDNWDGNYAIGPGGDGDVGALIPGADTIEFHYNITAPVDLDRLGLYYIEMDVGGIDSSADCQFYFNNYSFGALPATNATPWPTTGKVYYTFDANATNQPALYQTFNNITIVVPAGTDLFVDNFLIEAYEFDASSDGQVAQLETSPLEPGNKTTVTFNYTPVLELGTNHSTTLEPLLVIYPANWTWAYAIMQNQMGYTITPATQEIRIDYGTCYPFTWSDVNEPVTAIYKSGRQGDLPLLYEITPAGFDPSTSPKIVQFPGDIRVDGLTVMSSRPLENVSLELTGGITSVTGLGNASMSSSGIAIYPAAGLAPNYFTLNRTWERTTTLPLEGLNHTSIEAVLQTHVLPTTPNGTSFSGYLRLNSEGSSVYEIPLSLTIETPKASFLLIDDSTIDSIGSARNYDKLWDSVFEAWKIAVAADYDIDSLFQETYLYQYRNHELLGSGMETGTYLDDHVVNLPCEEELFYTAFLGAGLDSSFGGSIDEDFVDRGGTIIEFTATNNMGYDAFAGYDTLTHTLLGNSSHPLMTDVSQMLYMGGYFDIPQTTYDSQLHYSVLTGYNWADTTLGNLSVEIAGIYHDAIYPYRFSADTGLYPYSDFSHEGELAQDIRGTEIAVAGELIAQSWFLEQVDIWGYFVMQYYANEHWIPENFDVDLDNDQFIENIFHVGANQAPTILDVTVSPMHVSEGDEITVYVNVTDDRTPTAQLHVVGPEKLQYGLGGDLYDEFTYNENTSQFIGTFRVLDVNELDNWNIFVWDDMYRVSLAVEPCGQHLLPPINSLPVAWAMGSGFSLFDEASSMILDVSRGDLIQVPIYFSDLEDGEGIDCNASLVYYKNKEETETIYTEYFSGKGFGMFFADTSGLAKDGTYLIEATVGDSDGGIATYRVAGFNLGTGTLYKEKAEEGLNLAPIVVFVTTAGLGVGALAGGILLFIKRRG